MYLPFDQPHFMQHIQVLRHCCIGDPKFFDTIAYRAGLTCQKPQKRPTVGVGDGVKDVR
jgi:hypothetical protein